MRPRLTAAIGLFAGGALGLGLTALALDGSPTRTSAGAQAPQGDGPFLNGTEVPTIAAAEALFGRHIIRPSHAEVNDSTIRNIYFERIPGDPNDPSCHSAPVPFMSQSTTRVGFSSRWSSKQGLRILSIWIRRLSIS